MKNVVPMARFLLAVTTAAAMLVTVATALVAQRAPPNRPIAIICYAPADQSWRVGHLHRVDSNGDAIYLTADGRLSATVNTKGVVLEPKDRPAAVGCYGKTLDELHSNGRVMESQRTK